jgi:ribosomal protein S12
MASDPLPEPWIKWYPGDLSLAELQKRVRFQETVHKKVIAFEVADGKTYSHHDRVTVVPVKSLLLELDPTGDKKEGPGQKFVCRGDAMIGGTSTKIVAFRPGPV